GEDGRARGRGGHQLLVGHRLGELAHRQHLRVAHAGGVVNAGEGRAAVDDHHGDEVLQADIRNGAVVDDVQPVCRHVDHDAPDLAGAHRRILEQRRNAVEHRLQRRADGPFLDRRVHDLVALAKLGDEFIRLGLVAPTAVNRFLVPLMKSSTPVKPDAIMVAAVTPLRAPMPPKSKAFSTCSRSRSQYGTPEACWAAKEKAWRTWGGSSRTIAPPSPLAPPAVHTLCVLLRPL